MTAPTSSPSERRAAIADSSTGSAEANTIASAIRKSSGVTLGATASNRRATLSAAFIRAKARFPAIWRDGPPNSAGGGRHGANGSRRALLGATGADRAEPDRREGLLLAQLDLPFPREFKRGREGGSARGSAHHGIGARLKQKVVESRPVRLTSDEASQSLAGLGERPDDARLKAHARASVPLRLPGISRQKVIETG